MTQLSRRPAPYRRSLARALAAHPFVVFLLVLASIAFMVWVPNVVVLTVAAWFLWLLGVISDMGGEIEDLQGKLGRCRSRLIDLQEEGNPVEGPGTVGDAP